MFCHLFNSDYFFFFDKHNPIIKMQSLVKSGLIQEDTMIVKRNFDPYRGGRE
jgi:hypothetical protein